MVCYMWEHNVIESQIEAFRKAYQVNGDWCKLFVKAEGYIKTDFYEDLNNPLRFVTIDYWDSVEKLEAFRKKYEKEYDELDTRCDEYTDIEVFVGDFRINTEDSNSINFFDVFN